MGEKENLFCRMGKNGLCKWFCGISFNSLQYYTLLDGFKQKFIENNLKIHTSYLT